MRGLCSYSSVFQTLQACLRCHFLYTRLDASWKLGWPSYITSVLLLICFYRLENGSWIAPHILDQNSLPAWLSSWSVTSGTMSSVWGGVNTYSYARLFINLFPHIISDHLLSLLSTVSFAGLSRVSQMNMFSKPLSGFLGTELGSLVGAVRPWEPLSGQCS